MNGVFRINLLNGFVNLDTLSPNGNLYYQITKPMEISMGNWVCRLRFMDRSGVIHYYNSERFSHNLSQNAFVNVKWSHDGTCAFFYEYKRNEIYDLVLLDFKESKHYRLKVSEYEKIIDKIRDQEYFDKREIMNDFISAKAIQKNINKSSVMNDSKFKFPFLKQRWFPN